MPLVLWKTALISPPCATTFDMPQLRRHRSTFTATTSSAQSKSARLLMRLLGKTNPVGGAVLFYARILTLGLDRAVGIGRLPARRRARYSVPRVNGRLRHPQREAAAAAQSGLVLGPVRHLELHLRDVMPALGVELIRHIG